MKNLGFFIKNYDIAMSMIAIDALFFSLAYFGRGLFIRLNEGFRGTGAFLQYLIFGVEIVLFLIAYVLLKYQIVRLFHKEKDFWDFTKKTFFGIIAIGVIVAAYMLGTTFYFENILSGRLDQLNVMAAISISGLIGAVLWFYCYTLLNLLHFGKGSFNDILKRSFGLSAYRMFLSSLWIIGAYLVMIIPAFIFGWGLTIITIASSYLFISVNRLNFT